MKKLLIASTALVASAGIAAADGHAGVSLSGYAEMGIKDAGGDAGVEFHNDIDVTFKMVGETDGGLEFGATIDLDEVTNAGDDNGIPDGANDASAYIKGDFGTLTLGDTDGALDWAMQEVDMLTSIADDHTAHAGFDGNGALDGSNDGQVLRYDNTFGGVGVALSYELDDSATTSNDALGLGVKYSADLGAATVGFGLGYQENDSVSVWGISASTSISGFDVVVNYWDADIDGGGEVDHTAIGIGYTIGAVSLHANYGEFGGDVDADGFGLAVNYDLGGGAVVMAGYGSGSDDVDTWSLGLGLSF